MRDRISYAVSSLQTARIAPATAQDDDVFIVQHMIDRDARAPDLVKPPRVSIRPDSKTGLARKEAEEAAANILRHRIEDNERRHPAIFAHVRSPEFLTWYQAATGTPWDRNYEGDIDVMRYQILLASRSEK